MSCFGSAYIENCLGTCAGLIHSADACSDSAQCAAYCAEAVDLLQTTCGQNGLNMQGCVGMNPGQLTTVCQCLYYANTNRYSLSQCVSLLNWHCGNGIGAAPRFSLGAALPCGPSLTPCAAPTSCAPCAPTPPSTVPCAPTLTPCAAPTTVPCAPAPAPASNTDTSTGGGGGVTTESIAAMIESTDPGQYEMTNVNFDETAPCEWLNASISTDKLFWAWDITSLIAESGVDSVSSIEVQPNLTTEDLTVLDQNVDLAVFRYSSDSTEYVLLESMPLITPDTPIQLDFDSVSLETDNLLFGYIISRDFYQDYLGTDTTCTPTIVDPSIPVPVLNRGFSDSTLDTHVGILSSDYTIKIEEDTLLATLRATAAPHIPSFSSFTVASASSSPGAGSGSSAGSICGPCGSCAPLWISYNNYPSGSGDVIEQAIKELIGYMFSETTSFSCSQSDSPGAVDIADFIWCRQWCRPDLLRYLWNSPAPESVFLDDPVISVAINVTALLRLPCVCCVLSKCLSEVSCESVVSRLVSKDLVDINIVVTNGPEPSFDSPAIETSAPIIAD